MRSQLNLLDLTRLLPGENHWREIGPHPDRRESEQQNRVSGNANGRLASRSRVNFARDCGLLSLAHRMGEGRGEGNRALPKCTILNGAGAS